MKRVINFIEHLECPSINGIVYPNNTIQLFDVDVNWGPPINYKVSVGSKTSIETLDSIGALWWNSCAILIKTFVELNSIEIIAGEGDYGSDGFIAVIDSITKKTIWIAFLKCSNPFYKIEFKDDKISATSTIGCTWCFLLNNPVNCTVICSG
jgi:hypothetical protein